MPFEYRHPRPAVSVDCTVFAPVEGQLSVLLIRRDAPPFEGDWATPGGFVDIDEPIDAAARRELREETGLADIPLHEFGTFGTPGRDPRGRTISVAHWALVDRSDVDVRADSDARRADWCPVAEPPDLAFDHDDVLAEGLRALRNRARTGPIGRHYFDEPFALAELQALYELVLDRSIDDRLFRRRLLSLDALESVDGGYRFDDTGYRKAVEIPISMFAPTPDDPS